VTVAIPTLTAGPILADCLRSLRNQTWRDFEVIVIDNSGQGLARSSISPPDGVQVIENENNIGFGGAINQALKRSRSPFLAVLNDDAIAMPGWLEAMLKAMEESAGAGMCACRILLQGQSALDSAGMLLCMDGSSKQRGHGQPPGQFLAREEALFPSGCAALYRRKMLEEVGGFDDSFFLYCEDTDLGLRGVWSGWRCVYEPQAIVEHRYSATAGGASPLKAYYVERNRLMVLMKNFPAALAMRAPFVSLWRYFWHAVAARSGTGAAGRYRKEGNSAASLVFIVIRAHLALLKNAGRLWRQRREIRRKARISAADFVRLVRRYAISAKEVAFE
jgi:GT2 family glycosyltransferase